MCFSAAPPFACSTESRDSHHRGCAVRRPGCHMFERSSHADNNLTSLSQLCLQKSPRAKPCSGSDIQRIQGPQRVTLIRLRLVVSIFVHIPGWPVDDFGFLSKEAESGRWHKDTSRCCERIRRLVPSPQVRPRWSECAHQALRGTDRAGGRPTKLTRSPTAI